MTVNSTSVSFLRDEALAERLAVLRSKDNVADWDEIDMLAAEQLRRKKAETEGSE